MEAIIYLSSADICDAGGETGHGNFNRITSFLWRNILELVSWFSILTVVVLFTVLLLYT